MKRYAFGNILAIPYESGAEVDRTGALSAILGVKVSTAPTDPKEGFKVKVSHAEKKGGEYETVFDTRIFMDDTTIIYEDTELGRVIKEIYTTAVGEKEDVINFDIDLIGCDHFIKIEVEVPAGATALYTLTLADFNRTL